MVEQYSSKVNVSMGIFEIPTKKKKTKSRGILKNISLILERKKIPQDKSWKNKFTILR